jgi:hypothetical protein
VRSIEVTVEDDEQLSAVLQSLELVPLIDLIGVETPPPPDPIPPREPLD